MQQFCWVDLATADETAARSFYWQLFGWTVQDRHIGAGRFGVFRHGDAQFASLYQLSSEQIVRGIPSHWTPYVSVLDVDAAARRAEALGGRIVVAPHDAERSRASA
jgi:predicted enzyme related to lactoylglutathione lyase